MVKRYCDRCGQQIDEGVHAWYVLELHGTDGEFRHKELCEECYEYLCEKDEAPKADRKTENCSEKPNNCEDEPQIYGNEHNCIMTLFGDCSYAETGCGSCEVVEKVRKALDKYELKTKPTISKMEQVDEPQTCDTCKYGEDKHRYAHICNECGVGINNYEPKDEPQTDCAWK